MKNKYHYNDAAKTLADMRHRVVHPDLAICPTRLMTPLAPHVSKRGGW